MTAIIDLIEGMQPLTAEDLAGMSAEALSVEYFHGLECDPEVELDETRQVITEVQKRGLSIVDMRDLLIREAEAEREAGRGWPISDDELRAMTDEQLVESYFEEADLDKDSRAMVLIKSEILRRAPTLEEFLTRR